MSLPTVHIWQKRVDAINAERIESFRELLSPDERAAAARLDSFDDAREFIVCRGLLRQILSAELASGLAPRELVFARGEHGKPWLPQSGATALHFNVSHRRGHALIATCRGFEVGVDVETVRGHADLWDEAHLALIYTPHEIRSLFKVPIQVRARAFAEQWTRKEAVLKALGVGIGADLQAFEVPRQFGLTPAQKLGRRSFLGDERVHVLSLPIANEACVATVAVRASRFNVAMRGAWAEPLPRPGLDDKGSLVYCLAPGSDKIGSIFHEAKGK